MAFVLAPAPAYRFAFPGLPQEIAHSPAGMLTAGRLDLPARHGGFRGHRDATTQYGAQTGSLYDMVIQARQVSLPGNSRR